MARDRKTDKPGEPRRLALKFISGKYQGGECPLNEGQDVVVELPTNPSTGYTWKVVATDQTFGYPTEEFVGPDSNVVGAGGTLKLTWKTRSAAQMLGGHSVKLEYRRPWEQDVPAAKTFSSMTKRSLPFTPSEFPRTSARGQRSSGGAVRMRTTIRSGSISRGKH